MNISTKSFVVAGILLATQLGGISGCVGGGYVGTDGGYYYGGGAWFHDDAWVDGHGRGFYGHDRGYIHPAGRAVVQAHDRDHH